MPGNAADIDISVVTSVVPTYAPVVSTNLTSGGTVTFGTVTVGSTQNGGLTITTGGVLAAERVVLGPGGLSSRVPPSGGGDGGPQRAVPPRSPY